MTQPLRARQSGSFTLTGRSSPVREWQPGSEIPRTWLSALRGHGFTLIELLTVVAVIGILATILLPSFKRAKSSARATVCKSNLRQIGIGLRLYVDDFGKYPLAYHSNTISGGVFWYELVSSPYCGGSRKLFVCPDWLRFDWSPDWNGLAYASSYALNNGGLSGTRMGIGMLAEESRDTPVPESSVRVPSEMIAIGEQCGYGAISGFGWPGCVGHWRPHSSRFNAVFCDAHLESSKQEEKHVPNEARARRFFRDNEPHRELWPPDSN